MSNMDSNLYESDFSITDTDEKDYSESESEKVVKREVKKKRRKKIYDSATSVVESNNNRTLVSGSEELFIGDESVVILDEPKNTKITLPYIYIEESETTERGKVFTTTSITIISKKKGFEHVITSEDNNYINRHTNKIYLLKGGNSVVFHPVKNIWYADR